MQREKLKTGDRISVGHYSEFEEACRVRDEADKKYYR
jgi:hypothetical protein